MNRFAFGLVALLGLCGGRAEAGSIFAIYGAGAPVNSPRTVDIAEFDPSLGTLTGVTIHFQDGPPANVSVGGASATFKNLTGTGAPFGPPATLAGVDISLSVNIAISGTGFSVSETLSSTSRQTFPFGTSITPTLIKSIATTSVSVDSAFLSDYVGTGTTGIQFSRSALSATSSNPLVGISGQTQGNFGGIFTVEYKYDPAPVATAVPEPGSMTLLGLGALGMLGYRFKRRKADAVAAA